MELFILLVSRRKNGDRTRSSNRFHKQCPAHSGRRYVWVIPKKSNTLVHGTDVVRIGNKGGDEGLFDGVFEGANDIDGAAEKYGVFDSVFDGLDEKADKCLFDGVFGGVNGIDGVAENDGVFDGMDVGLEDGADIEADEGSADADVSEEVHLIPNGIL